MKHLLKHIMLGIVGITTCITMYGQSKGLPEVTAKADSSQRIWMRQALQLNDTVITKVFMIRDNMYQQVNAIRNRNFSGGNEQEDQVLAVRKEAETAIRKAMGQAAYQLYTERIRQRLYKAGNTTGQPLTGTGN